MKKHKRWPGGRKPARRHLSPSDIKRKNERRGMVNADNLAVAKFDPAVLSQMTVTDLRNLCESRDIKTTTKFRKSALIELLVSS